MKIPAIRNSPGCTLRLAAAAIVMGSIWDISWDASIGRHSFSSPPHVLIHLGALAAALAAFGLCRRASATDVALAIIAGGAALALAVAEVLQFGQPVQPDDFVPASSASYLAIGAMVAIVCAAWIDAATTLRLRPLVETVAAGMALTFVALTLSAFSLPNLQRTALFLQLSAATYPGLLFVAANGRGQWPATCTALTYTGIVLVFLWALPLFPATPAMGPVYEPVTHMLPPRFPLLLILPALGIDLFRRVVCQAPWARALAVTAIFVGIFLPAQWFFAAFLLSPASDNHFFAGGGRHWPFFVEVGAERALFWGQQQSPVDAIAATSVLLLAILSVMLGHLAVLALDALRRQRAASA